MNGKRPQFSVVVTVYNKGNYIRETLESVLCQTCRDFEVIIVDDGSTDNSKDAILSLKDESIKYLYQEHSGLPASSRNKGISSSEGRYIALLDGDDLWLPDKLERCREALERFPDAGLIYHNVSIMYGDKVLRDTSYGPSTDKMYERLLFQGNCLCPSAVVLRREIFFNDGMRFSEEKDLFAIEDYEYWLRLSKKYKFYYLPDILGRYKVTEKGAFLSSNESNTGNLLRLLDRHFSGLDQTDKKVRTAVRKRRSFVMCAAGRTCQHTRNFNESMSWYSKALKEYPYNLKALIGMAMSLLKIRIIYG